MSNFLSSIEEDGFSLARVSSTDGGEYAGACPWCGGKDRFRVWPEKGSGGKYWCRQCNEGGDHIDYLMKHRGWEYSRAVAHVGHSLDNRDGPRPGKDRRKPEYQNTEIIDQEAWEQSARESMVEDIEALKRSIRGLVTNAAFLKKQQWLLEERGLNEEMVIKNFLGYSPRDSFFPRKKWGLVEKLKDNSDEPKKLFIPAGLRIPLYKDKQLVGIRVRKDKVRDDNDFRYYMVPGSRPIPMIYGTGESMMIVESDLDAMLIAQEAGDLVRVVALGSAAILPNEELINEMATVPRVLLSLDRDNAGTKGMVNLVEMLPNAYACLAPGAKDITESWKKHNIDVRKVVLAGLQSKKNKL